MTDKNMVIPVGGAIMSGIFGKVVDCRIPVSKSKLDEMKLECFNQILEQSHIYYEVYEGETTEYGFDSESFGEWVEGKIVEFHNLKEEDKDETSV